MSCASSGSRRSTGLLRRGETATGASARTGRSANAAWKRAICSSGSPLAVGQEADARHGVARESQDELVQRAADGLHREAAAAHGEDRAQATASGDAAAPGQSGSMATSIASPSTDSTL